MPEYTFLCKTHGNIDKILPISANLDTQKCTEKGCKEKVEHVYVRTAPPKLVGGGFHANSYIDGKYKGS